MLWFKKSKGTKVFRVPSVAVKAGSKDLGVFEHAVFDENLARASEQGVLFNYESRGQKLDFAFVRKPGAKRLFVLFCGAANRKKIDPPVFQRWKWADRFPGHALYVSDPALKLSDELGLAWYIGTRDVDYSPLIQEAITKLAGFLRIPEKRIVTYGSSGGGFAALRMLDFMPNVTAVAINPQVSIKKYDRYLVNKYLRVCHDSTIDTFDFVAEGGRFDLSKSPKTHRSRIILCQNTKDEFHYENHFRDYCTMLGIPADREVSSRNVHTILFEDDGGHVRAENSEVFTRIMNLL